MAEGDVLAIERIAAAEARSELVRLSLTKRISGRTHHKVGSQRSRYSSRAVTTICDVGAIDAARSRARCNNVAVPPRRPYCTGTARASNAPYATHSGAGSSAATIHQRDFRGSPSLDIFISYTALAAADRPCLSLCRDSVSRNAGKRRVNCLAIRQLTVAETAACHAVRRAFKLKLASNVLALGIGEIRNDAAAVVSDKLRSGVPIIPPSKSPPGTPAVPQRSKAVDRGVIGDLKIGTGVEAAVAQSGDHGTGHPIEALPGEVNGIGTRSCRSASSAHGRTTDGEQQRHQQARSSRHAIALGNCGSSLPCLFYNAECRSSKALALPVIAYAPDVRRSVLATSG